MTDLDMVIYRLIGERVKEEREGNGFTQEQIAEGLTIGRTAIANLEAGREAVGLGTLSIIAARLGLSLGDLMPEQWVIDNLVVIRVRGKSVILNAKEILELRRQLDNLKPGGAE